MNGDLNCLGSYGPWAANLVSSPARLSFLQEGWSSIPQWKQQARKKVEELCAGPQIPRDILPKLIDSWSYDGLTVEALSWQLPYGPETRAFFFKPQGAGGPLPGILGLHDHGGVKYFGKQKITRTGDAVNVFIKEHQDTYYNGKAWACELARRGYAVLVHDVFPFESRKIELSHLPAHVVTRIMTPPESVEELKTEDIQIDKRLTDYNIIPDEPPDMIRFYNAFGGQHEHIIAKSLFCAGTTWPGVFMAEDRAALDVLASRADVDAGRLGCCGLSGGGMRTNYLAGLDDRIRCSVTVGFMTTWRDFLLNVSFIHSWMVYIPLLSLYLDYPEVLGLRVPLPSLVQCCKEDPLYTIGEMRRASDLLTRIYEKAGASEHLKVSFFNGPHRFHQPMQEEAFAWLDRWLKAP